MSSSLLGRQLLKYKLMYYHSDKVHLDWHQELTITDQEYDSLEQTHKAAGGRPIVDFPLDLPCGQLVLHKYSMSKEELKEYCQKLNKKV